MVEHPVVQKAIDKGATFKTEEDKQRWIREQEKSASTGTIIFCLLMVVILCVFLAVHFRAFNAGEEVGVKAGWELCALVMG